MFQRLREFMTGLVPPYEDRDYMTRHMEIEVARQRLRDEFAMAALTGLLSSAGTMGTREGYCQGAYEFADAMMKAREAE